MTFTKYIITKLWLVLLVSSFVYLLLNSDGDRAQSTDKVILSNEVSTEHDNNNDVQRPRTDSSAPID